ncbi:hypothetical protein AKUH4B101A_01370 [Apilactobacillus kunkeei]|uniref:reverse transcriptase domain-containing protein n=1 Tax=Apilactobacillus waqarii TaxID=2851006 RepID=UPI0021FE5EE8|nr:hypothetical protein AKUH4B403J_01370 [Apilactobacillus kunkeei]CAI2556319.1 hypothetical protein AKUH4B103J_01370 [Apilactobacillus kunkeei]CAI2556744.1 hypothetical protein AKUH4B303J_01370 [Apilactobacillus kunkeei]CAI2556830.1 hypothetical protein AKUH4B116J_01370 [Apilactobacillus kunkeei]CAI2556940.1 hypothetical protein AKUH4B203M_01370 [Apilactobacillus kunkeei]
MGNERKRITDMDYNEARDFLLKPSSYVNINLPTYFDFSKVIDDAVEILNDCNNNLSRITPNNMKYSYLDDINYKLAMNKDDLYDWRPLSIIHPVLYVHLVNIITEENFWNDLMNRFKDCFQKDYRIKAFGIPVESNDKESDKKETILNWWENFEQQSISYALDYKYCIKTDITNCYGSVYTHSIPWAIHGKNQMKKNVKKNSNNKNKHFVGDEIDKRIRWMQNGQTNGMPQGSVLFDFIAEIILGYADKKLSERLDSDSDFRIIRYRDDYRIYANDKSVVERILRELSDVLADLNMHFNSKKTKVIDDIIISSVKEDKLYWMAKESAIIKRDKNLVRYNLNLQKHLLQIYELNNKFPNSGSVAKALDNFLKRILSSVKTLPKDYRQIISIVLNIILSSPKAVPVGTAIISNILGFINDLDDFCELDDIITQINKKMDTLPNVGFIEIWMQRLNLLISKEKNYNDPLCNKVTDSQNKIWNSSWLNIDFSEDSIIRNDNFEEIEFFMDSDDIAMMFDYISI